MDNSVENNEKLSKNPEAFSYSWYPTQCDMSKTTMANSSASRGQETYQVLKTDGDEELVVVEQEAPEQPSQNSTQFVINIGNKFTDQQVKVLMKSWKELCDKRQHIRTCDSDWHDITDKVNMEPGTAKTVKQVKKKFKNLRDRYRAFKIKNKKRNFGFSRSLSFSQFEQVYGDMDCRTDRPRQTANNTLNNGRDQGGASTRKNKYDKLYSEAQGHAGKALNTSANLTCRASFHPGETVIPRPTISITRPTKSTQMMLTSNEMITEDSSRSAIPHALHTKSKRAISGSEENELHQSPISPRIVTPHGGRQFPNTEMGQFDSSLVNAVRELQQQQITMQREIMRSVKQTEERLMQEISSRINECEDRFRQQIANALTQLGNLMRIV